MSKDRSTRSIAYVHSWFFEGYEEVEYLGTDGRMHTRMDYHGKIYGFEMDEQAMKKLRIRYAVLLVISIAIWVLGVFHMSALAARLPGAFFAIGAVPEIFYIVGFIRFLFLKDEFNNRQFHQSYKRMEVATIVKIAIAGLSLFLCICWFAFVKDVKLLDADNIITALCCAAMTVVVGIELKTINAFRYKVLREKDKVVENADFSKGEKEAKKKPTSLAEYFAEAEEEDEDE